MRQLSFFSDFQLVELVRISWKKEPYFNSILVN